MMAPILTGSSALRIVMYVALSVRGLSHSIKYSVPCFMVLITFLVGGLRVPGDVGALILDFIVPLRCARMRAFHILASRIKAARACEDICLRLDQVIFKARVVADLLRPFVSKEGLVHVRRLRLWQFLRAQSRGRGRLRVFVRGSCASCRVCVLACGVRALP